MIMDQAPILKQLEVQEVKEDVGGVADVVAGVDAAAAVVAVALVDLDTYLFLSQAIGLKTQPSKIYFKKVLIAHDWHNQNELETIINQEIKHKYEIVSNTNDLIDLAKGDAHLIIMICMQYNYSKIKKLYFCLAESSPSSAISVAYLSGNIFRISQPYIPIIGNACHFCLIERQLNYERVKESRNSWSALLNFCVDRHVTIPTQHLSLLQRNLALGTLIKK